MPLNILFCVSRSLILDNFSCKVTLDIVTTDYEDTKTIEDLLRNHIKNNGRLGKTTVTVNGFNAQLIDPGTIQGYTEIFKVNQLKR